MEQETGIRDQGSGVREPVSQLDVDAAIDEQLSMRESEEFFSGPAVYPPELEPSDICTICGQRYLEHPNWAKQQFFPRAGAGADAPCAVLESSSAHAVPQAMPETDTAAAEQSGGGGGLRPLSAPPLEDLRAAWRAGWTGGRSDIKLLEPGIRIREIDADGSLLSLTPADVLQLKQDNLAAQQAQALADRREGLVIQLLFAARQLADSQLVRDETPGFYCIACSSVNEHRRGCVARRVEEILAELETGAVSLRSSSSPLRPGASAASGAMEGGAA